MEHNMLILMVGRPGLEPGTKALKGLSCNCKRLILLTVTWVRQLTNGLFLSLQLTEVATAISLHHSPADRGGQTGVEPDLTPLTPHLSAESHLSAARVAYSATRKHKDVTMIWKILPALVFTLVSACSGSAGIQMGMLPAVASSGGSSSPAAPSTTGTADTLTVNLLGICSPAGAETSGVQYLQRCPNGAIAELVNTGNKGQVATLWAGGENGALNAENFPTFSKELELCLDIAAGDCAGGSIPGAPGDGHLWSHDVLHIISYTATVFEDKQNQYASISSAGFAVSVPVVLQMTTVTQLPMCDAALKGALIAVSDAAAPGYNATLIGGGATSLPAYCNGSEWTAH